MSLAGFANSACAFSCSRSSRISAPRSAPSLGSSCVRRAVDEKAVDSGKYRIDASKPVKAGELQKLEEEFITAMQSFYYDGRSNMSEVDFLTLQEELLWSGSQVAILSDNEKRYLDGCWAKEEGEPIMTDAEFVDLVKELQKQGSPIVKPRDVKNGGSSSLGIGLAALAALGILAGLYSASTNKDPAAEAPPQPQPTQKAAPSTPEPSLVERLNFLRKGDETAALQAALAEAQSKLGDAEKRVESMAVRLEAGRAQIDQLEASISALSEEKSRLEGTQKEQDQYLVTLNDQLSSLETQAEQQRLMLQSLTGPSGRMADLRAKMEAADAEVQRLKQQEAEMKRQRMEELSRLESEKDLLKMKALEELARLKAEKEELAAKVEKETMRYRSERDELASEKEKLRDQALSREMALLSERDAIKATAEKQARLLEMIAAPDGKISALKSEVARAESAAVKLREEMAQLQASLEAETASYAISEKKISDLEGKVEAATAEAVAKAEQKAAVINDINAKVAAKAEQKAQIEATLKQKADALAAKQVEAQAAKASAAAEAQTAKTNAAAEAQAAKARAAAESSAPAAEAAPKAESGTQIDSLAASEAPAPASADTEEAPKSFRRVYGKYSRVQ